MLTCCPVVVRPPFVWPRSSLPFFLSFALQLALGVQVPVGSLLPYGSPPSRWCHPCRVEAAVALDRNEGLVCFSFRYGLILPVGVTLWVETVFDLILDRNVAFLYLSWGVSGPSHTPVCPEGLIFYPYATVLRAEVTLWVQCVDRFPFVHGRRLSFVLSPISFRMGFEPLSEASLRALSLPARFLVVLAEAASLRKFLALSSVLPYPMMRFHDHLHCTCSRPKVVISAWP